MLDHKNVEKFREELKADSSKNQSKIKGDKQSSDPNKANALYKGGDKENQNKVSKQGSMSSNNGETVQTSLVDGSTESSQLNPDEVISLIGLQWQDELKRVKQIDLQQTNKKEITSTTLVEGGHAEIEDDTILFIYGNAYEIVLNNQAFQQTIEKIQFQYILFDFLIETRQLQILSQFVKLKELVLKDNYISSLLQLAKLEVLKTLKYITIENSPLNQCQFLKEFIVYRFPQITKINGKDVTNLDKQKARQQFQQFDKILQLPEKFYNAENTRSFNFEQMQGDNLKKDKHFMKTFQKQIVETSEKFINQLVPQIVEKKSKEIQA